MSTWSDNLKIELLGTGDTNWGNLTNNNFKWAIEESITGYATATFPSDADYNWAAGYTNSNSSQAQRCLVINVTGSLTATRNLIVPTIEKQYIIQNNTTGSQSIVVKTSAGTGITVPNGKKAHLYADGTNVIQMVDYFVSPTLVNATISGQFTAEAGSVSAPSITTTGDLNTGIYFPAADSIAITQGGVQAIQVHSSGNICIGSENSPTTKLDVYGGGLFRGVLTGLDAIKLGANTSAPSTTDSFIYRPANNTLAFGTASTEQVRIDSSGNVGIGTTAPANKMHVQVTNLVNSGVTSVLRLDHQASGSPSSGIGVGAEFAVETAAGNTEVGATIEAISTDVAPASEDFDLVFKTMSAGATAAERMRIDSLGNLGIGGITTPLSRLDALTAGGSCLGTFRNGTTTAQVGVTSSGGGQAYFGSTTNHLTRLIQNGTTQLQISTTGLVQMDNGYGSLQTFYGCRAWVNFDGTAVTIGSGRANGNVNSITDNGTGDYTINFTNAMPDANYAAIATCSQNDSAGRIAVVFNYLTTSVKVGTRDAAFALFDASIVNVAIFR